MFHRNSDSMNKSNFDTISHPPSLASNFGEKKAIWKTIKSQTLLSIKLAFANGLGSMLTFGVVLPYYCEQRQMKCSRCWQKQLEMELKFCALDKDECLAVDNLDARQGAREWIMWSEYDCFLNCIGCIFRPFSLRMHFQAFPQSVTGYKFWKKCIK